MSSLLVWQRVARQGRLGQALVEFALVFPILFLIIVGGIGAIADVSYFMDYEHALNSTARLAAIEWQPVSNSQQVTTDAQQQFQHSLDRSLGKSTSTAIPLQSFKVWSGPCAQGSSANSCVFVNAAWKPPAFPFLPALTYQDTQGYKTEPD